jgi:predicted acetyltransferase
MKLELRAITDDEVPAFRACMMNAFGDDTGEADPDGDRRFRALIAHGNAWAMFDGAQVVGVAGLYDLSLGMPGGGSLGCAGLTMVGVRSTHRRRGILTQLMAAFDARAREHGHAIAGLWASEARIYGRYGFAVAAYDHVTEIGDAHALTVAGGGDELEWIEEGRARELLPDIYARSTAQRPGVLRRDAVWWQERRFLESPFARRGASKRRHVIATRDGAPVGYVQYRQRTDNHASLHGGRVEIIELHGIDTRAVASLWRYVCAIDLHPTVFWPNTPVDDPLHLLADNPRLLTRKRADSLWLRVDDIPRALAARSWGGELRLGIGDAVYDLPSGAKTTGATHVTIAPSALPRVLIGGLRPSELATAGLASGDVMAADRVFATPIAPWCPEVF